MAKVMQGLRGLEENENTSRTSLDGTRADVLVCVIPTLLAATYAAALARVLKKRLVLWIQDLVLSAAASVGVGPTASRFLSATRARPSPDRRWRPDQQPRRFRLAIPPTLIGGRPLRLGVAQAFVYLAWSRGGPVAQR